jgi:hypothetical protein
LLSLSLQDYAPANFISRISIGVGCVGMYTVQYLIYFSGPQAGAGLLKEAAPRDRAVLLSGLTAVLCLSVVGAVCSGEALPECRGSTLVHYTAAILFFVLYDVLIAVLLAREQRSGRLAPSARRWLCALGVGSALSKARVLWPLLSARRADGTLASPRDFPGLAVFEWSDVGTIISFTQSYVAATCGDLSVALVRLRAAGDSGPRVLWRMDGHKVLAIALRYAFGTLVACLVISIALGTLDKPGLPMISDTFVWPPGNWVSRWAGVIGITYLSVFHSMFWLCYRDRVGRLHSYALLALSTVGGLACSLVMVVSETEDRALHMVSAVSFFALYDAFILYYNVVHTAHALWPSAEEPLLAKQNQSAPAPEPSPARAASRGRLALLWALWLLSAAAKARFMLSPALARSLASVLEWADALSILAFLVTAPAIYHAELGELQFVILDNKSTEPGCA